MLSPFTSVMTTYKLRTNSVLSSYIWHRFSKTPGLTRYYFNWEFLIHLRKPFIIIKHWPMCNVHIIWCTVDVFVTKLKEYRFSQFVETVIQTPMNVTTWMCTSILPIKVWLVVTSIRVKDEYKVHGFWCIYWTSKCWTRSQCSVVCYLLSHWGRPRSYA